MTNIIDLDRLLSDDRISILNVTEDELPKTFEEWVALHGEPDYLYESKDEEELTIKIIDCTEPNVDIDPSGIIEETKNGKLQLNYPRFLDVFTEVNPIVFNNGVFYTPLGPKSNDTLKQDIHFSLIDHGWKSRLDAPVKSLYESLKNHCAVENLVADEKLIPLANGDLHLNGNEWEFHLNEFKHCAYRLSVNFIPGVSNKPLFDKWLQDVFEEDDIPTVQEIFGYALVPVTSSQEAFIFVGDAGVGKSGVGTILQGLLGNAYVSMETQQLVTERFQIATVENKLVAYDDDLGSAALTETGLLKKLITADVPIQGERKFADPHEFNSYCRIIASANFMLSSLYDSSDGFYRRLHPILVKNKDANRKDINGFYERILNEERSQVLNWALEGLYRVINNGWTIHWSERSRNYLSQTKSNVVHFPEFIEETCELGSGDVSLAEIKRCYKDWCRANGISSSSDRRLEKWLVETSDKLSISYTRCIRRGSKQVRGYTNICLKNEWNGSRIPI